MENKYKSQMLEELRDKEDGGIKDKDHLYHQTAADYMCHILGFCGCGQPLEALKYILNIMRWIKVNSELNNASIYDSIKKAQEHWKELDLIFNGNDGAKYFALYRLSDLDLTEHGGSVPGWLTEKGFLWLEALEEAILIEEENEN